MSKRNKKELETKAVGLITLVDPSSPVSEQYRTIRTNLQFASSIDRRLQTMVITSSGPGEGKSTTSANLAIVFAKAGQRVLLVDADMRKPTVYKTFQLSNNIGLSTLLSTNESIIEAVQQTMVDNLSVLPSGPKPPNPSELLGSQRMNQVINELKQSFDIVIFDMPPIVTVTDAQIMASKVDGTLLIVRENITNKESLSKAKELLKLVNAHVLGTVYNGAKQTKDQSYYYY
ncbi:MAG: CpsD/CapB family tyrosine-protein kinase [Enterococcus sp.]|nr:CpsD/CapB family tyrosine-protein kinase [Enterococcus sp.]